MQLLPTPSAPTMAIRTLSGLLPPPAAAALLLAIEDDDVEDEDDAEEEACGCTDRDLRLATGGGLFMRTCCLMGGHVSMNGYKRALTQSSLEFIWPSLYGVEIRHLFYSRQIDVNWE